MFTLNSCNMAIARLIIYIWNFLTLFFIKRTPFLRSMFHKIYAAFGSLSRSCLYRIRCITYASTIAIPRTKHLSMLTGSPPCDVLRLRLSSISNLFGQQLKVHCHKPPHYTCLLITSRTITKHFSGFPFEGQVGWWWRRAWSWAVTFCRLHGGAPL